jgi:nicotinamide riboside kinase
VPFTVIIELLSSCLRVVIVCPESTGKSTFASSQLATYYQCPLVTEYGREFCEEQLAERELLCNSIDNDNDNNSNNNNNDHPKMIIAQMHSLSKATSDTTSTETEEFIFTEHDFETIMIQQGQREEEAARKSTNGMIICDTNIWATLLWYERYKQILLLLLLLQRQVVSCTCYKRSHNFQ